MSLPALSPLSVTASTIQPYILTLARGSPMFNTHAQHMHALILMAPMPTYDFLSDSPPFVTLTHVSHTPLRRFFHHVTKVLLNTCEQSENM